MAEKLDIDSLARRIDARFPALSERAARVALAVHRVLAQGRPVPDYAIAAATGLQVSEVHDMMQGWPGVYRDDAGAIVGFWGLALGETPHRFVVEGRSLYTWCAWDAVFLPELLGHEATVASTCSATGAAVELSVAPERIVRARPPGVALSFIDPSLADVEGDRVISTFCHHILFFSTRALASEWAEKRGDGAFTLDLDEAFALGRACNALRYARALTAR